MHVSNKERYIDPEKRPLWSISLIVLIIDKLCKKTEEINAIHEYYLIIAKKNKRKECLESLNGKNIKPVNLRKIPSVDRAIKIGESWSFFEVKGQKISLSKKGVAFAQELSRNKEIFIREKKYLTEIAEKEMNKKTIKNIRLGELFFIKSGNKKT